jgi:hypothetical protein
MWVSFLALKKKIKPIFCTDFFPKVLLLLQPHFKEVDREMEAQLKGRVFA